MKTFYQTTEGAFRCSVSKNLNFSAHLHKQIEIIYVLSGKVFVTINQDKQELSPGNLAISFPNTIHSICSPSDSLVVLMIFDCYLLNIPSEFYLGKRPQTPFFLSSQFHTDITYCIQALTQITFQSESRLSLSFIKSYLTILFSRLIEPLDLVSFEADDLALTHQVLMYIDNHFSEPLSLDDIATKLNISKFYISHIFNKQLHTTFTSYLSQQRILMAQSLLMSTDLTITEISFQSGFENLRTFYRIFSQLCHMTPSQYRSKKRLENSLF